MAALTPKEILAANDLVVESVACPEWGGVAFLRRLTPGEAVAMYQAGDVEGNKEIPFAAMLVAWSLCDETGSLSCEDPVPVARALAEKGYPAVKRCFMVARRLSAIGEGEVEARAKN